MLNTIHSLAKGIGAKILLALLILSFAIWGIGDMLRRPGHTQEVATIGKISISRQEFQQALRRESEKVRRALGDKYSPELFKSLQVPQQVLQILISRSLLEQETRALGLKPADGDIAQLISQNPAFQDEKGQFDKDIFYQRLNAAGISEAGYIEQLRRQTAGDLILDTLDARMPVPEAAVRTLYLGRQQQRAFTLYVMDTSLTGAIPQPDEAQLKAYYQENDEQFAAPEYRTLSYTTFTSADMKDAATVSQEELQAAYDERRDEFRHEERRTVGQLLYGSEDQARQAYGMAKAGKSFAAIAKDLPPINKSDIQMGTVSRQALIGDAADAVFSLKQGGISEPVHGPFGWHVFKVTGIQPAAVSPLADVRDRLEKDLARQKLDEETGKLANALEDALAGGSTLKETAAEHGLTVHTLGPVNAQGLSPAGKKVEMPDLDKFMDTAFKTDEKAESSVIFSKGTYYIVRVDTVEPEHVRPLADVKDQVRLLWMKSEREKKLADMVDDVAAKLADAKTRPEAVSHYGIKTLSAGPMPRTENKAAGYMLPPQLIADIFVRRPGESTKYYPVSDGVYLLAVVDKVIPATLPADTAEREKALSGVRKELEQSMRNEIIDQYMAYLAGKYPVSVEPSALETSAEE